MYAVLTERSLQQSQFFTKKKVAIFKCNTTIHCAEMSLTGSSHERLSKYDHVDNIVKLFNLHEIGRAEGLVMTVIMDYRNYARYTVNSRYRAIYANGTHIHGIKTKQYKHGDDQNNCIHRVRLPVRTAPFSRNHRAHTAKCKALPLHSNDYNIYMCVGNRKEDRRHSSGSQPPLNDSTESPLIRSRVNADRDTKFARSHLVDKRAFL